MIRRPQIVFTTTAFIKKKFRRFLAAIQRIAKFDEESSQHFYERGILVTPVIGIYFFWKIGYRLSGNGAFAEMKSP